MMEIKQRGSHLDHLVRQTRMHHSQLSSMADMKANMLLTMASVVITLSVRYVTEPHLKWATTVLIFFCLLTIGLATYAVMPKIVSVIKRVTSNQQNILSSRVLGSISNVVFDRLWVENTIGVLSIKISYIYNIYD